MMLAPVYKKYYARTYSSDEDAGSDGSESSSEFSSYSSPSASRWNSTSTSSSGSSSDESLSEKDLELASLKAAFVLEFGETVHVTEDAWVHSLYGGVVSQRELEDFFEGGSSGYKLDKAGNGRWRGLQEAPRQHDLCTRFSSVIARIVNTFNRPLEGMTREIVNSSRADRLGDELKGRCPDISIKATGPSFEAPETSDEYAPGVGYSNVASVIDVSFDQGGDNAEEAAQHAAYCRQIFLAQPNRNFTRSLIATPDGVRLIHYDRSGVYITPYFDIHQHPYTFIRLVLGLSSNVEEVLGLDSTVQWSIDESTGKRTHGTIISSVDANYQPIIYHLKANEAPFVRPGICGRGTTSWHAYDPVTGHRVLIKDTWRASSKRPEAEFLEAAKGIPGVVQMIAFQDWLAETKDYRPEGFGGKDFESRTKSRVVLEHYGLSIEHFTSRFQVISAIRDALEGHRKLLRKFVLHRNVTTQNILFGAPGAPVGSRGILIDLDLAIWTDTPSSELQAHWRTSLAVLRSVGLECSPIPTFLDDLEAFFYVLSHIILLFKRPGVRNEKVDKIISRWDHDSPKDVAASKIGFAADGWCTSRWWGKASEDLIRGFQRIIRSIHVEKSPITHAIAYDLQKKRDLLEAVGKETAVEDWYAKVLKLFDDALLAIDREDREAAELVQTPPVEILGNASAPLPDEQDAPTTSQRNLKRRLDGSHPDAPTPKRSNAPPEQDPPICGKRTSGICPFAYTLRIVHQKTRAFTAGTVGE
ncbi:hypothetical protein D9611_005905 [Ephemerocybe angulata]|uniref:Fungal-type protein kinase domain-containing protein n=1 Tax=Ephemerocybe angulata TaxID=980116 RepID=A0A8H5FLJ1_9AGAR|nr:hypothetical protein D9611_005905 [Tulosesus angulatus]